MSIQLSFENVSDKRSVIDQSSVFQPAFRQLFTGFPKIAVILKFHIMINYGPKFRHLKKVEEHWTRAS